jgi:hypothetical protein
MFEFKKRKETVCPSGGWKAGQNRAGKGEERRLER